MKKVILALLLVLFASAADAQIQPLVGRNNNGQPIVRFFNSLPRPVSCFYQDQYNYYTFIIPPQAYSMWYPIYGPYNWGCN